MEEAVPAADPPLDQPPHDVPPATASEEALGSLRVDAPAEGTVTFAGFGPASFGATAEEVRQAWGGDLGDAQPSEPGGCYYLIPQPVGTAGFRTAFMVEGDKFARIDVRDGSVVAPGGAKVGMTADEVRALYPKVEEQPHKYDPAGKVLRVADPGGGSGVLVLELDKDGRVDEWRIGVPPQVDYVEGCS
ncbi:MAG: lectin [Luteimonas sp.]|nr:lectin [Luteimonas sp.]